MAKRTLDGWNFEPWALNAGFMSSLWYTNMMEQQKNKTDQIWKVFGTKRRNLFENTAVPSKLRHCPVYADINIKKTPPTRCIHCTKEVISGLTQGISNKNAKTFLHNSEAGIPLSPMRSNRNIYEYIYIYIYFTSNIVLILHQGMVASVSRLFDILVLLARSLVALYDQFRFWILLAFHGM